MKPNQRVPSTKLYIVYDPTHISQRYYVGVSNDPLRRIGEHTGKDKEGKKKKNWIDKMARRDVVPEIHTFCSFDTEEETYAAEVELIAFLKSIGVKLANVRKGGQNPPRGEKKGTEHYGEDNKAAKLKQWQVNEMRTKFFAGISQLELSKEYNISPSVVNKIVWYETWKKGIDITPELLERVKIRCEEDSLKRYDLIPEPWNKGKVMTEEYCQKNSESHIGIKPSAENLRKRSEKMKGRMPKNIELLRSPEITKKRALALSGEGNGCAILTDPKVLDLRAKHASKQYKIKELAEMFGIKECTVYDIVGGRTWRHLLPKL